MTQISSELGPQHAGLIAIVGRPNVGKSTLLNAMLGQKVSITSRKPQTTRHRVMGIYTEEQYQAVFVDTPGLHKEEKRAINRLMNRAAASSLGEVEMIIFVVEGTHWTEDDELVLKKLKQQPGTPVILAINKIDNVKNKDEMLPHIQKLSGMFDYKAVLPVSAKQRKHTDTLRDMVRDALPECEHFFPEDYITDRSSRFMASEIIREKLMRFMGEELPYSITVEIEQFKWQENGVWQINGLILVERDTQKRMVIGKKGEKLKTIGTEARRDLEEMLEARVHLELWVKVKSGWADDERALRSLGYGED